MAYEPDMEFLMLLANVIVCLQLNFALYNTLMTSYPRQIAVLRSLVLSGPSPGPIRARNRFCKPRRFWIRPKFWIRACVNCCFTSHYDRISVFERFSVDNRIRYENGSVDANRSMRFRSYKNAYI